MCDVGSVLWIVRQKTPGKFIIISLYDLYPCNARNNNDGVLFYFPISVMKWLLEFFFCLFLAVTSDRLCYNATPMTKNMTLSYLELSTCFKFVPVNIF